MSAMFRPGSWGRLESQYAIPRSHVPLSRVVWASLGSPLFGKIRNMLSVGSDAHGLVLQLHCLFGASRTLYIPWAHVRRAPNPTFSIALFPRETFLLGAGSIPLTIPEGHLAPPH
jgi:hypothetical protein